MLDEGRINFALVGDDDDVRGTCFEDGGGEGDGGKETVMKTVFVKVKVDVEVVIKSALGSILIGGSHSPIFLLFHLPFFFPPFPPSLSS